MGSVTILRRFPFSSSLRRMSVVVCDAEGKYRVLTKGAPEVVKQLLRAAPRGFDATSDGLMRKGMRCLCLAARVLEHVRTKEQGGRAHASAASAHSSVGGCTRAGRSNAGDSAAGRGGAGLCGAAGAGEPAQARHGARDPHAQAGRAPRGGHHRGQRAHSGGGGPPRGRAQLRPGRDGRGHGRAQPGRSGARVQGGRVCMGLAGPPPELTRAPSRAAGERRRRGCLRVCPRPRRSASSWC
jgi:hypothetical protein